MKGEYRLPIYGHRDGFSVVLSCLDLSTIETELINEAERAYLGSFNQRTKKEFRLYPDRLPPRYPCLL